MILCAAIKLKDWSLPFGGLVVPCHRHHNGFEIIHALTGVNANEFSEVIQGFITHRGDFLDRECAYLHAISAGQISAELMNLKNQRNSNELFSEDLY